MKPNVRILLIYVILVVVFLIMACSQKKNESNETETKMTLNELESRLLADSSFSKETPFEKRKFDPTLGEKWIGNAVAYSGYRKGQQPGGQGPSNEEILEDLHIIKDHWNLIRTYGADKDTKRIVELIDQHELPIKVVMGVWIEPEDVKPEKKKGNIEQTLAAIELAQSYPHILSAISVGNETQVFWSGHRTTPGILTNYIRAIRSTVSIPVTTADDYLYWNKPESQQIAEEIDFVFTHIHPLWNGQQLENGIMWMDSVYKDLQKQHADKEIIIGETGWATDYDATITGDGQQGTLVKGEVSIDAQATFLIEMHRWIESNKVVSFLFEVFDESWKGGGENSSTRHIEKHWGVFTENRVPKDSFLKYVAQNNK